MVELLPQLSPARARSPRCRDSADCIIATRSPPELNCCESLSRSDLAGAWGKRVSNSTQSTQIAAGPLRDSARTFIFYPRPTDSFGVQKARSIALEFWRTTGFAQQLVCLHLTTC